MWGIWALGATALVAWCAQFVGSPWRTAVLAGLSMLAARGAWAASRLGEGAQLRWDGLHWSCDGAVRLEGAGATVHLDLQSLVLVRLHKPGRPAAWLWLERASCPSHWLDLRRALHACESRGAEARVSQP
ncbi:MAG: hypothetical protein JSS56_03465 [Proteobacteria bacterium]|nr:hypothetical protein [Pseudomonadota bacterium]